MKKIRRKIDDIQSVLEKVYSKSSYGNVSLAMFLRISMNWGSIVGDTLSNICKPIFYNRQILTIVVADSTWANEIMFHKNAIIKKIFDILEIKVSNIITRIGTVDNTEKIIDNIDSLLEQKMLTDSENAWVDSIIKNIESDELKQKLKSTLITFVKTGGDTENL